MPIVEPEVLVDGDHTMARSAEVTEVVLHEVFHALHRHRVTCAAAGLAACERPGCQLRKTG